MSNTTKLAFDTGAAGRRVAGEARSPQLTYRLDYPEGPFAVLLWNRVPTKAY